MSAFIASIATLDDLHRRVQEALPLRVHPRDVERALAALAATEDLWEAARRSRAPLRVVAAVWAELAEAGLLAASDGSLRLTEHGRRWLRELGIAPGVEHTCPTCEGRSVVDFALAEEARERFRALAEDRPAALQQFDQGFVSVETTLARVSSAQQWGDIDGRDVFVLGDDDLVSLAVALAGRPRRVLAVDIDERLVEFIAEAAAREKLPVEAAVYDLREPLPEAWTRAFDTFFCDPTESLRGLTATLGRGLLALRGPGAAGYFGQTHVESSLEKWARVQRFLLDHAAVVTSLVDEFNQYENWEYVREMRAWAWLPDPQPPAHRWYRSAWYRFELLEIPDVPNESLTGNIFDDEEAATT